MLCRIADFRCREVINIRDGLRLGFISDILFNTESGQVHAIVIPGPYRFFGLLGREDDYVIPWEAIRRVGEDIVLVDTKDEYRRESRRRRQRL